MKPSNSYTVSSALHIIARTSPVLAHALCHATLGSLHSVAWQREGWNWTKNEHIWVVTVFIGDSVFKRHSTLQRKLNGEKRSTRKKWTHLQGYNTNPVHKLNEIVDGLERVERVHFVLNKQGHAVNKIKQQILDTCHNDLKLHGRKFGSRRKL